MLYSALFVAFAFVLRAHGYAHQSGGATSGSFGKSALAKPYNYIDPVPVAPVRDLARSETQGLSVNENVYFPEKKTGLQAFRAETSGMQVSEDVPETAQQYRPNTDTVQAMDEADTGVSPYEAATAQLASYEAATAQLAPPAADQGTQTNAYVNVEAETLDYSALAACPSAFAYAGPAKSTCFGENAALHQDAFNWGWSIDISDGSLISGDLLSDGKGCDQTQAHRIGSFTVQKKKCDVVLSLNMLQGSTVDALHVHVATHPFVNMNGQASVFPHAYDHQFAFGGPTTGDSDSGKDLVWSQTFKGDCDAKYILFHANACPSSPQPDHRSATSSQSVTSMTTGGQDRSATSTGAFTAMDIDKKPALDRSETSQVNVWDKPETHAQAEPIGPFTDLSARASTSSKTATSAKTDLRAETSTSAKTAQKVSVDTEDDLWDTSQYGDARMDTSVDAAVAAKNFEEETLGEYAVCPSAFAYGGASKSTCFGDLEGMNLDKKQVQGWSIDISSGDHIGGDVIANAKGCDLDKGEVVGNFFVQKVGCDVTVDLKMADESYIVDSIQFHLDAKPFAMMGGKPSVFPSAFAHDIDLEGKPGAVLSRTFENECESNYLIMSVKTCGLKSEDSLTNVKTWNGMAVAMHSARNALAQNNSSKHVKTALIWILSVIAVAYLVSVLRHECNRWLQQVAKNAQHATGEKAPLLSGVRESRGQPVRNYYSV